MKKIGIIGVGGISQAHINGYLQFPDQCEIVALCDIDIEKAKESRDKHGLTGATVYGSLAEMLADQTLDVVSITTPPSDHAPATIACLEAGVNVLVEKPMAPSLQECDAMIAAQKASGKVLAVIAQNRFRDDMVVLKKALDSGLIGPISHLSVNSAWSRSLPYYDLWWRGTWESEGGGCTLNHAVHHLDLTLWLMGVPKAVTAVLTNAQHENAEVEDLAVAILSYDRALAEVTASVVHHGEDQYIVAQGRNARVSQPWKAVADKFQENGFPDGSDDELVAQLDAIAQSHGPLEHAGHAGQIGNFLDSIAKGVDPAITAQDGRNSVELVTAIYKSGFEGRTVTFPLTSDDPFYSSGTVVDRAPRFYEKTASVSDLGGDIVVGATTANSVS